MGVFSWERKKWYGQHFSLQTHQIESTQFGVKTQIEISENILDKIAQANVQSFLTNQNRKITKILLIDPCNLCFKEEEK